MASKVKGKGTKADPWQLTTPSGQGQFQMYRDETADPPALVCTVGKTELRFQTRAEAHLPVALASMVCKYVRELSMELAKEALRTGRTIRELALERGLASDDLDRLLDPAAMTEPGLGDGPAGG